MLTFSWLKKLCFYGIAAGLLGVSLIPFLGMTRIITELCEQYRLQWLMLTIFFLLISAAFTRYKQVMLIAIATIAVHFIALVNTDEIARLPTAIEGEPQKLRVLSFNVFDENKDYARIEKLIREVDADIVILPEGMEGFIHHIEAHLREKYPYLSTGSYDVVMTKEPHIHVAKNNFKPSPNTHIRMEFAGKPLHVMAIHTFSPKSQYRIIKRNEHFRKTSEYINTLPEGEAVLIAGDYNSVSWQRDMRALMQDAGLYGYFQFPFQLYGSWASFMPLFLRVPIDHILMSRNIKLQRFERLPDAGSDHLPIMVDVIF